MTGHLVVDVDVRGEATGLELPQPPFQIEEVPVLGDGVGPEHATRTNDTIPRVPLLFSILHVY